MAAVDTYAAVSHNRPLDNSAIGAEVVTPHNTTTLTYVSRAIYVGVGGDITALMLDGTTVLFAAVPQGTTLPIRCQRINSTATTATTMISMY